MRQRGRDWPALIQEQKMSGLTQVCFCAEKRIGVKAFQYWKSRLKRENTAIAVRRPQPRFVELNLGPSVNYSAPRDDVVVELPFGVTLRFRGVRD